MTFWQTIIIGIVEGLTEFLPISSTAHMDIARAILGIESSEFFKSFQIIIQLGAILAVAYMYARTIFSSGKYIKNLLIAFLPTALIGFILYKIIKSYLLGNLYIEALALLLGGIVIIVFENYHAKKKSVQIEAKSIGTLSVRELVILGTSQALAVIPGISRSGAVIISGRALGLSALLITEFSFLLAIPTMLAASGYDILKSGINFQATEWGTIALGFVVSFVTALFVVRWLLSYIRTHSFKIFGWYRIGLGVVLLIALYYKVL